MYCITGRPFFFSPTSFREYASLYKITLIVSACMSKESHFSFDNLGKDTNNILDSLNVIILIPVCSFHLSLWSSKEGLYIIQILCRLHPLRSYPAGLTIDEPWVNKS